MSKTLVVDKPCYDTSDTFESHVEDENDTALDRAVNQFRSKEKESARAELLQLRAAAAERDRLQAVVDELKAKANVSICAWCGQECEKSATGIAEHVITCEKRPEHAMLVEFEKSLATITAQDVRIAELEQDLRYMNSDHRLQDYAELEDTIVAQAAQLEQAHNDGAEWMRKCVMDVLREKSIEFFREYERRHGDTSSTDLSASNCAAAMRDIVSYLPTWLAANAPAPEAEPVSAFEAIDKLMTERGDLFNAAPGTEATK